MGAKCSDLKRFDQAGYAVYRDLAIVVNLQRSYA